MVKTTRKSGRLGAVLLGASLVAGGAAADGAPAAAVAASCHSAGTQPSNASPLASSAPGQACGVPATGSRSWGMAARALLRGWRGTARAAGDLGSGAPAGAAGGLVPKPGSSSRLAGVFCTSSRKCWAVGAYRTHGAELNQALRWNGSKWSRISTPNPGGTASGDISELFGIRCTSHTNCWAVGDYEKKGAELNQALRWNGSKWSRISTPNPGGTASGDFNDLFSVVCTSPASCWAAGEYGSLGGGGEVILNLALHWNGRKWSKVTTPDPAGMADGDGNALDGVRCTSASNCWAVGVFGTISGSIVILNEALHWNGSKWSLVTTPNPGGTANGDISELAGLTCTSATNCWAAGAYGTLGNTVTELNQALHWDGAIWTLVSTPDPDGTGTGASNVLNDVSCTSSTNCWAVGDYGSFNGGTGVELNGALHWKGSKWSLVPTPDPAGTGNLDLNILSGVRCASSASCWAVGDRQKSGGADANQALRWNGSKWATG